MSNDDIRNSYATNYHSYYLAAGASGRCTNAPPSGEGGANLRSKFHCNEIPDSSGHETFMARLKSSIYGNSDIAMVHVEKLTQANDHHICVYRSPIKIQTNHHKSKSSSGT
ncbi:hypothetical protein CBL_02885 [Carabus blaptoides fortunei]